MISSREKKIINELIYHNGTFMLIKELAGKLGVSSRTVHRELKNVRDTLRKLNIELISEYKKGVKLDLAQLEIEALTKYITENADKDLSGEEKKVALVYNLLLNSEGLKKSALAVELGVSEHTVDELILQMESQLRAFSLEIRKTRSIGVQLVGDALSKQNFLASMMISELNSNSIYSVIENNFVFSSLVNNKVIGILEADNIFKVERLLMDELVVLPYTLTENAYLNLTLHIVLAIDRTEHEQNVSIKTELKEELKNSREFGVSRALTDRLQNEFDILFPEEEVYFITMHLRGSKRKSQSTLGADSLENLIIAFIDQVSREMDYPFYAYPELKDGLVLHIEPMLHRMDSGIITVNPLVETIKDNYPGLFEVVGEKFRHYFNGRELDESEIGFLTIHFGGILHANPRIEVTTVCSSGIGTSRILSNQLKTKFNNLYIRQELSISELSETEIHGSELVLSTVPLDMDNYILVSPLLDEHDEKKITEAISKIGSTTYDYSPSRPDADISQINPDQVIQASELYLNRTYVRSPEAAEAIDSVNKVLKEHTSLDDNTVGDVTEQLGERFKLTGSIIGEDGFSYPHIKSPLIREHQLIFIHNEAGITDKNYDDVEVTVHFQVILLVPENSLVTDLVSEFSVLLGEHHENIGGLLDDASPVDDLFKHYIKNIYVTGRK